MDLEFISSNDKEEMTKQEAKKIIKDNKRLDKLLKNNKLSKSELESIIKSSGYKQERKKEILGISGKHFKYGYFSDAHMGCKKFIEPLSEKMSKLFKKEKVDFVINCGDTLEGMSNRPGHVYELSHMGFTQQFNYACGILSQIEQPIYGIDGNHDCLDIDTEVLTKDGWKFFNEISMNDKILSFYEGYCSWDKINNIIIKDKEENEDMIEFHNQQIDMLVTPKHRILHSKRDNKLNYSNYTYTQSKDISGRIKIVRAAKNNFKGIKYSDDELKLIAWVLTDGHHRYNKRFSIYQSKYKNVVKIKALLDKLNIKYSMSSRNKNIKSILGIKLKSKPLTSYCFSFTYNKIPNKYPFDKSLYDMNTKQFNVFFETLIDGDGSRYKNGNFILYGEKSFLDNIQVLCSLNNKRSTLVKDTRNAWRLNITNKNNTEFDVSKIKKINTTYKDKVWCLEVPKTNFYVRRNGKSYFTGNSWYYKKSDIGLIVGDELSKALKNYNFLGQNEGKLSPVKNVSMMLFHPNDGSAYANCFDNKTEILTENGWKLFKDLNKTEKVATLNLKKDEFQWQLPTDYTEENYDGKLLHFKARCFDLIVTPNHRMLVRKYPNNLMQSRKKFLLFPQKSHRRINFQWQIKTAKELINTKRQEWQMKRNCTNWEGELIPYIKIPYIESKNKGMKKRMKHIGYINIEDIAELIGWYVTEGYIRKSSISICQSQKANPINHEEIINLIERIGFKCSIYGRDKKDINFFSLEFAKWLLKECGHKSRNKFLPKWLKNQPKDILKIVFDTMIKGDGWLTNTGFGYKSISKKLINDISEISLKLGYAVTTHKNSISISKVQTLPTINNQPKLVDYKGKIYCVSVPNTIIMVRRNGIAIWSGNSYKLQKLVESFTGGEKPNIVHEGHYHKALYMFVRNTHAFESGTLCSQTEFMRGKKLQAHIGFGIVDVYWNKKGVERLKHEFVPYYELGGK